MGELQLRPIDELGSVFDGDRSRRPPSGTADEDWRTLTSGEVRILESRWNTADNWRNIRVKDGFSPERIEHCRFYGTVRIGALSASCIEFHDLRLPVGLSRCTVVSSDIGENVAMHNIGYLSRTVVSDRCILFNVNEIITTDHAKFGNGQVMDGEDESVRIWLEIANENGGRRVLPFDGMLPADAWIWSKYRDDRDLMDAFFRLTCRIISPERGTFGFIGSDSVIKDCRILKDVRIGDHAYIKGCNKLKNLTINSDERRPTQLGEGCELVNGIIGYDCHIFYGVKAVRFILCDHSNLKYGARLINSILGSNSTISCCEVLNSLIFGSHEQHHNSSFLCASVFMGQTNMASAATVGSNHNSRAPDGEVIAGRGFWPGLSVSLKHNSRFAAFCLISKGAYPSELDIPLPFSLVANSEHTGELMLMPGYWFRHNMYALARNAAKTAARDRRLVRHQELEYDWLAPDTVEQMIGGRAILEAWADEMYGDGRTALETGDCPDLLAGNSRRVESGHRPVRILHAGRGWADYGRMIRYWAVRTILSSEEADGSSPGAPVPDAPDSGNRTKWVNVGGQLMTETDLDDLKNRVKSGTIDSWEDVHRQYRAISDRSAAARLEFARAVLDDPSLQVPGSPGTQGHEPESAGPRYLSADLLEEVRGTALFIVEGIESSRRKDYVSPFRNITYDSPAERDAVLGRLEENEFLRDARTGYERIVRLIDGYPMSGPGRT